MPELNLQEPDPTPRPSRTPIEQPDPAPFEIVNGDGKARMLLVCDHASRIVPSGLNRLGLEEHHFTKHIAYDIGAAAITRMLAERLDAPAVLSGVSRLVVDLNRAAEDPGAIPKTSDTIPVPGNQGLDGAAIQARLDAWARPYHDAVSERLAHLWRRDEGPPALFSIHSFTPAMNGRNRIWDIGVLWNRDPRLAIPLIERLGKWGGLTVGDNEPYSGRDLAYTIDRHGGAAGIANAAVEIRQDHVETDVEAYHWADILSDILGDILADPALHTVRHY